MHNADREIIRHFGIGIIVVVDLQKSLIRLGLISLVFFTLRSPSSSSVVECAFPFISPVKHEDVPNKLDNRQNRLQVNIGPCKWIFSEKCPNPDIKFYLYTRKNPQDRQLIHVDETWEKSNLSDSNFNPSEPTKIILHGYNSDMFLTPLIQMKAEYFERGNYNLFFVDWSELARAPCYPSAAHNTKYAGECIGQLVNRIHDAGSSGENIHIIGFSLGAHVAAFAANHAKNFKIRRITALDPALPLFITAAPADKLDPTDAEFVDVYHSNAFVQGQIERCGTVDFYMNGGILQPGCFSFGSNPFACSHHRAAEYFTESILSDRGFWGWSCNSYYSYLLGMCPRSNELHLAGEDCRDTTKGMFLITTNSESPFASGQWTLQQTTKYPSNSRRDPFLERIDEYGKLESAFNFANSYHKLSTSPPQPSPFVSVPFLSTGNFRPYEPLTNQINQNEFETTMNHNMDGAGGGAGDKSRFDLYNDGGDLKLSSTTERWRQNDKFILVENPLVSALNRTMSEAIFHQHQLQQQQQQSGSSDEFQFPKVTYR
ncbi:pancreatic triacylglycerol lipase [Sitodiplosis mosellana]|uniref:pancreatic triacylglycerol lipase n=1 Tax=Sitodiplosis mosellana TaxID=263140 RepID=UPI0024443DBC|nr:pancreatic triacylglycerol lipase [Sitodiplosis mosellana]XP_055319676.1 pancreatic triacylglycerol lipase [Sitodiplosis mosellana]